MKKSVNYSIIHGKDLHDVQRVIDNCLFGFQIKTKQFSLNSIDKLWILKKHILRRNVLFLLFSLKIQPICIFPEEDTYFFQI